jgi:hypothetical protein
MTKLRVQAGCSLWGKALESRSNVGGAETRRGNGCAKIAPVSVDRTRQRGRGRTEGCPEQLTVRRSSPWHWTGRRRDGGRRTGNSRRRAVAELPARVGRARERPRGFGRGCKWARGGGRAGREAQKGRGCADVDGERTDVGASTAGRSWAGGEGRLTGEDDETERERARTRETTPTDQPHRAARERERGKWARSGLRRQTGLACQAQGAGGRGRARGLGLLGWLGRKWPFPFSWNLYCLFYLFSLGFSIPIQIKFQIQTKSNMCNNSKNI